MLGHHPPTQAWLINDIETTRGMHLSTGATGTRLLFPYASTQPFNFTPNGGQFDFVWLSARTPHVGPQYVWCLTARRNQEKYPPETHHRSFS